MKELSFDELQQYAELVANHEVLENICGGTKGEDSVSVVAQDKVELD